MHGWSRMVTYMVAAAAVISASSAFNIDMKTPVVYHGEQNDFFGYKVLQYNSAGNKGIIITAPRLNGTGGMCRLEQNKTPEYLIFDDNPQINLTAVKHLGSSIAADPTDSQFTVCSPSFVHECNGNSYLNSLCYNITDGFRRVSPFKPAFQECTKKTVDLVFLFDGSGSMTEIEFNENKKFIKKIMNSFKNTSIKFAAAQFSIFPRVVFDFNDSKDGTALGKLDQEPHMKSLTNTYKALRFVLDNLFENSTAGASADAIKALVIITDGDPSDPKTNITEIYDEKNIVRFVIGIYKSGSNESYREIGSNPKTKHVFPIEAYDGLEGILDKFQNKIFKIEGSNVARAGNMAKEMSQSGFSAVFYKDTLVLGSVGSNSWRGTLQEWKNQKEEQILDPEMEMDSYLGYSTAVGERNGVPLYFTGAPRFNHTGQVVLFRQDGKKWSATQRITSSKIGSYFGAELCSLDVDSDGNTDFLLVGAPMFYQPQEKKEGRIYIYSLTDETLLQEKLIIEAPSSGRFGSTIASLADLNGDGLRDVAVGAPLEDNNGGVVYLYLGDRHKGIHDISSQKIMGKTINSGIRFFGQAINGRIDLGDDGLPDIVVGSQGAAVVLRSKPVYNVKADLSFHPAEISTENIDCLGRMNENVHMVNVTVCFEMTETTKNNSGAAGSGLNILYTLNVEPTRETPRGFFIQKEKKTKNLTSTFYQMVDKKKCIMHDIYMQKCVRDTLSPINIKLNFSQDNSENSSAVLNVYSSTGAKVEVPFHKQCRENSVCIAKLEVDFGFLSSTLMVKENKYFNISISLSNHGDDSYNTSLTIHYPLGLSYSVMSLTEASRHVLHNCKNQEGLLHKTVCDINPPVFRSQITAKFIASFHVMKDFAWNDTMSMTIAAKSDSSNSSLTGIVSVTKSIPVQYEIGMALTVKDETVTYLNFTTKDAAPKNMLSVYRIDNTGFKDFPVNVTLFFPLKLERNFEMNNYQVLVQPNKTESCSFIFDVNHEHCSPEQSCTAMKCLDLNLKRFSAIELSLSGSVQFRDLRQQAKNIGFLKQYTGESSALKFKSFIRVDYDENRYVLSSHYQKKTEVSEDNDPTKKSTEAQIELIFLPNEPLIYSTGSGLGLLLLIILTIILYKLGCFKRKTVEYYQQQENKASLQDDASSGCSNSPTNGLLAQSETDSKPDPTNGLLAQSETDSKPDPTNGLLAQSETDSKPDQTPEENVPLNSEEV
ncbi:integrin alpha-M [Leuresthes tenuis]|uniref:integrin alpha-M n=1 Tax=Leuresthes tenuis TaxID=355514 RepID=UPI003B50B20A